MQAKTIDGVIAFLDDIIRESHDRSSRHGYFASLYRRVTVAVKLGIMNKTFEDGARMEMFDVTFANRYFEAYDAYRQGQPLTDSWRAALQAVEQPGPILMQHLLLGMNAHINLDLGVTAATVCPGSAIQELKADFFKINLVLASLVGECARELGRIWPIIAWANAFLDTPEEICTAYALGQSRNYAWGIAEQLSALPPSGWADAITRQDRIVNAWAQQIFRPILPMALIFWIGHITDHRTVAQTLDILNEKVAQARILISLS
jgi:hypothetical protein